MLRPASLLLVVLAASAAETIAVDANLDRHPINPLIYGVAFATTAQLQALNAPSNRWGGNTTSRYNWRQNADNKGSDWYFESIDSGNGGGQSAAADAFIDATRSAGAQPLLTVPIIGWVARLGASRGKLASFSIAKYGAQTGSDWEWMPDAGNGVRASGGNVTGNDPNDANVPADVTFQRDWITYLTGRYGAASAGGLRYYLLDNEHSIWQGTHRDVHPTGASMDEIWTRMSTHAAAIKAIDPGALVVGPEEWGYLGIVFSGLDQQNGRWSGGAGSDRAAHGNMDYLPWLLQQFRQYETTHGVRLLDVCTSHTYPTGNEYSNDTSAATQAMRNRSTRALWDPAYMDENWVGTQIRMIPRLKQWVATYYPGTLTGITEYNWGAESHINGATAQADIYGIFGREGLDMASRWTTPDASSPTFKAMQMYRNYDGARSGFGDTSVRATVADPDRLSSFAAVRGSDGALTVMVINKATAAAVCTLNLANFAAASAAQVWQLTSANTISQLADLAVAANQASLTVPAQSITLVILAPSVSAPTLSLSSAALSIPEGGSATFQVRLSAQPAATTTVSVARTAGDSDLGVSSGASLSFTTANWNAWQTVTLAAAEDADTASSSATITVSAAGLTSQTLAASEIDNDSGAALPSSSAGGGGGGSCGGGVALGLLAACTGLACIRRRR